MEVKDIVGSLKQKWQTLLEEKPGVQTTERICINLDGRKFSLVHLDRRDNDVEIKMAQSYRYDDIGNLPLILKNIVDTNHLEDIPLFWLLEPTDYQLHLIDYLPVPDSELRNALNWRIRSMISYPITDAVIDYFKIPAKKSSPDNPMIAAVVSERNLLKPIMDVLESSNLKLATIDIPELALRNLTSLYEEDEKPTAMIYFTNNNILLNITKHKALYFTRRIDFQIDAIHDEQKCESLSLEILRYFDYVQSQWRLPTPSRIFVAAFASQAEQIATLLSKHLMIKIDVFSLKPLFDSKNEELIKPDLLLTFGAALREGIQYVPARD